MTSETYEQACYRLWYCALESWNWNGSMDYTTRVNQHYWAFREVHRETYNYIRDEIVLTPAQAEWSYAYTLDRCYIPEEEHTAKLRAMVELRTSTTG